MSVSVQRETRRVVAQHRGHRFHVHAILERHGREGVTQVMGKRQLQRRLYSLVLLGIIKEFWY